LRNGREEDQDVRCECECEGDKGTDCEDGESYTHW